MLVLTASQMKKAEQNAVDLGMSWLRLMENAGSAAAKEIRNGFDLKDKKTVIVCGKGNNGGDGYLIARKLHENGISTRVVSVGMPSTESAKEMYSKVTTIGIRPLDFEAYESLCCQYIADADIIIDALFGTGFSGAPKGIYGVAIAAMEGASATKIAIDIPSGIDSDKGQTDYPFLKADMTVTFAAYKPCHLSCPSNEYCGKTVVASIGIPDEAYSGIAPYLKTVTENEASALLPKRSVNCHKGICGTAGMYVGSKGYSGAAVIAIRAAVKSGVGIANAIIPDSIYPIIGATVPEAVCTVLNGSAEQGIDFNDSKAIVKAMNNCTVGLIGCGLGQSRYSAYNVKQIMREANIPLVIDADGINILSDSIELIRNYPSEVIITPHPKEAARLLKCEVDEIQSDRVSAALRLSELTGAVTVLKGAGTLIATPDGGCRIVTDGNPAMSTAGTGDMLAGMAVAFAAQGLTMDKAALLAVKMHAMCGDLTLKTSSLLSLTPTDMLENLPRVISNLYNDLYNK